jgi:UDP-glucose 4-epimerase
MMLPSASGLASKSILVTGASGFIGSSLCRRLHNAGARVSGISRVARAATEDVPHWIQANLCDTTRVRELVSEISPDIVFHLAGDSRADNRDLGLVLSTFENLAMTVNLLTASTETRCRRIVLIGSLEEPELGATASSPYAAARLASRVYAEMFHQVFGAPAVVARTFMTYGPGQKAIQKLVPYVTLSLLRGESPKLSSGKRLVDWIYIDDVARGLVALAEAPGVEGRTLDLGSGSLVSTRAVVQELVRLTASQVEPIFGALQDRPMETSRVADINDTYRQTGWKPQVNLSEGLSQTIVWYREQLRREKAKAASAN